MKKAYCFLFCLFFYAGVFAGYPMRFQAQVYGKKVPMYWSCIALRAIFMDDATKDTLVIEDHKVSVNKQGVFDLLLGDSLKSLSEEMSLHIYLDYTLSGQWIEAGKSKIYIYPYAMGAKEILDTGKNQENNVKKIKELYLLSGTDTVLCLLPTSIGTGGCTKPRLAWSMGSNQKMYFRTTEDNPYKASMINFHWTILSSKPAIVTYDENFVRHYAVVAHYWSNSGRPHQHISMEVDDDAGAVQTRFEYPWGFERIVVESHSADFRIDDGGNFFVGENRFDSARAYVGANLSVRDVLCVGLDSATLAKNDSRRLFRVGSTDKKASFHLKQAASGISAVDITRGETSFEIANGGNLRITSPNKKGLFLYPNNGLAVQGGYYPASSLSVMGNIKAEESIMSSRECVGEYKVAEEEFGLGEVVGINPATGKARKLRDGDIYVGISVAVEKTAFRARRSESSGQNVLTAFLGPVYVKNSQIEKKNGKAYTPFGDYIGIVLPSNYVVLTLSERK